MGFSKRHTGSFSLGFVVYAATAVVALTILLVARRRWVGKWVAEGGRAATDSPAPVVAPAGHEEIGHAAE